MPNLDNLRFGKAWVHPSQLHLCSSFGKNRAFAEQEMILKQKRKYLVKVKFFKNFLKINKQKIKKNE